MGHEASGTIHSIGSAVTQVSVGDRVAIEPGTPCRFCNACKNGTYHLCRQMRFAAAPGPPDTQGTLCKYFLISEDFVYKVDEGISLMEAVCVEPTAVGVHAVRLADVRPGETVVIMGSGELRNLLSFVACCSFILGTIGLLVAAVARQFGAHRIILVDILEKKLEFARSYLGVETFCADIKSTPEDDAAKLLKEFDLEEFGIDTTGGKIDTVIEASGAASSINMGVHLLRPGGKYVQTGVGKAKIEFPIVAVSNKELMFRGCFRYGAGDYELAVKLITKGLVQVKPLLSSVTPFEDATKAWDKTASGEGIKNLIEGAKD